ncbi:hypothetical protein Zmor_003906 [Zophobas morio]|uniref:Uncharacterized protein n=1 Tax=Zophobas morio TaxID=2755281 RepID=A0AA38HJY2_9CUCU|nr:hypothetical protein Zmor_003906 [Zophobas morio]
MQLTSSTATTLIFCPMRLHMLVNKYEFKRPFSINVFRLDATVSLWKSTVSRKYRRASRTSDSDSRYSGVFLPTYQQTSCGALTPVLLLKDNIFNTSCSILSYSYLPINNVKSLWQGPNIR